MSEPTRVKPPPESRAERWIKRLAVVTTVGMFLVVMMGSTVTNTGSGEGCGRHWPLCQGEFIPEYAVETAIEFSHRIITAIEGVLIAATAIGALYIRRGNREVRLLVAIMVGTLLTQSGLGAAAVMWPQSPKILAIHFGVSMTAFAAIFLLTRLLYERSDGVDLLAETARSHPLPGWYRIGTWGALAGAVVVAYIGAFMRHSGNEFACHTWPGCNGKVFPGFQGSVGIAFGHRFAASMLMLLVFSLSIWAWRNRANYPSLWHVNGAASIFITLQALAGGAVVLTELSLWSTLAHAALMAWFFVFVTDACRIVLKTTRGSRPEASLLVPAQSSAAPGD